MYQWYKFSCRDPKKAAATLNSRRITNRPEIQNASLLDPGHNTVRGAPKLT